MSVARARIIKAGAGAHDHAHDHAHAHAPAHAHDHDGRLARRIPRGVVEAKAEAERILAEARAGARGVAEEAAREAREREIARVAAEVLVGRAGAERRAERELDHCIELAVVLAERLVGEAIAVEPARAAALAVDALEQTRGARQVRIEACPEDVGALRKVLAALGEGVATIEPTAELSRGSLVVHTELGRVDARLAPQLSRLADALRELLRGRGLEGNEGTQGP